MRKEIIINGKVMHLVLYKTVEEWKEEFGNNEDCWDMPFEEFLDDTLEVNGDIWYWYIDGRCYETTEEV